ncbi:MAG TPA: hypothetical protein VEJ87_13230 [Acidimicrobiales bacterium]|nr:hypothetical protein [Acidimicrobiales bacterium]
MAVVCRQCLEMFDDGTGSCPRCGADLGTSQPSDTSMSLAAEIASAAAELAAAESAAEKSNEAASRIDPDDPGFDITDIATEAQRLEENLRNERLSPDVVPIRGASPDNVPMSGALAGPMSGALAGLPSSNGRNGSTAAHAGGFGDGLPGLAIQKSVSYRAAGRGGPVRKRTLHRRGLKLGAGAKDPQVGIWLMLGFVVVAMVVGMIVLSTSVATGL